jgi:hypothetical protein
MIKGRLKASTSRLLLITNDGATLYAWQNRALERLDFFSNSSDDLERFELVLNDCREAPFSLVVDYIEEDFRHETMAHVLGKDRKEMLERKQAVLFRSSPFRIARVLGRETTGRRDDKVVFMALSKPELILQWTRPLLAQQISIRAITSASFLIESMARQQNLHKKNQLMLITVEPNTGIRQTYLHKGSVLFSRLVPMRPGQDTIADDVIEEQAVQTHKYLERIKLLPYDKELETIVLRDGRLEPLPSEQIHDSMRFAYQDASLLPGLALINGGKDHEVSCVLAAAAQTLRRTPLTNTYGQLTHRRYYFINIAKQLMYASGFIALIGSAIASFPILSSALEYKGQAERLNMQTTPLLHEYELLRDSFPETPIPSNSMALIAQTYEKLVNQVRAPEDYLIQISVAVSAVPEIQLNSLDWLQEVDPDVEYFGLGEVQQFMQATLEQRTQIRLRLTGSVDDAFSIRSAHENIIRFIQQVELVTGGTVTPIALPTDVSANSALELALNDDPVDAPFVLELVLAPQTPTTEAEPE